VDQGSVSTYGRIQVHVNLLPCSLHDLDEADCIQNCHSYSHEAHQYSQINWRNRNMFGAQYDHVLYAFNLFGSFNLFSNGTYMHWASPSISQGTQRGQHTAHKCKTLHLLLLLELALLLCGRILVLLVFGDQVIHIALRFCELHLQKHTHESADSSIKLSYSYHLVASH